MAFPSLGGFEWDEGNRFKNWLKHNVSINECEEIFSNEPLIILPDTQHSGSEKRILALGKTNQGRKLTIVFTIRKKFLRVISGRNQNR